MYQLTDKERSLVDRSVHDGRTDTWAIVHVLGKTAYDTILPSWHKGVFKNRRLIIMGICSLELLCLSNRGKSLYEMSDSELKEFRNDVLSLVACLPSEEDFKDSTEDDEVQPSFRSSKCPDCGHKISVVHASNVSKREWTGCYGCQECEVS